MIAFGGLDGWIPIFRAGRQTDAEGRIWDGDDLIEKAVAGFDASKHEPPVVVGHPRHDAPAFGWVAGLKREGDFLMAKFRDLVPEFVEAVRKGLYKKRSAAFYPDGRLRHVGFLGAAPPAVKGLPDIRFEEDAAAVIEFAATEEAKAAQKARSKKYGIAVKEGGHVTKPGEWESVPDDEFLDPVNYRYPCPDADQTRAAASYWGQEKNRVQYTPEERSIIEERLDTFRKKYNIGPFRKEDTMFKERFKNFLSFMGVDLSKVPDDALPIEPPRQTAVFTEADLDAAKRKAAEEAAAKERERLSAEFAEKARQASQEALRKEISAWCDTMIAQGRLTPALVKFGVPEMLAAFAEREEAIEFGEEKEKATLYERFKALFETELPKVVRFGEIATRDRDVGDEKKRDRLIGDFMEKNRVPYREAVLAVAKEHPDLFKRQ